MLGSGRFRRDGGPRPEHRRQALIASMLADLRRDGRDAARDTDVARLMDATRAALGRHTARTA